MGYIGAHGVETLKRYKYSGQDHSVVAKYVLQPFWSRCVTLFPLWMPPNMITLTGFMFLVMSAFLGYIYSPHLDTAPPRWVHLAHGLLLFLYQTFDAVDGKQARRTSSSSPLGELFDHGAEWWAQDFRKSIPLLSWVPLPFIPDIPLYVIVMILMILFAVIPTIGSNVSNVQKVVDARKGSMVLALAMLLPFIALLAGVAVWSFLSPSDIMRNQPHLLVIGTGFAFGYLVGRMILAHLCDEPRGLKTGMCLSLVFLPFAIANALTAKLNAGIPLVDELLVLFLYCAYTVGLYLHLAVSVVHEIKDALGIYCFRITRKEA
uniref:Aminoalcoholphosphotransferase n=1 Tax=Leersia perrieri TaxID=77586 RepID=A0A0D9WN18_9ORYZ